MKQADVVIGETYIARVSGQLVKVVVVNKDENSKGRTVFRVKRLDTGKFLPNTRTAAALR